jgi:hypothetical protein
MRRWVTLSNLPPVLCTNTGSPKVAYCQTSKWVWDQSPCPIAKLPTSKLRSTYAGKRVLFVGDSEIRNVYHQFVAILDPTYQVRRWMSEFVGHCAALCLCMCR